MNLKILLLALMFVAGCAPANGPHKPLAAKASTSGSGGTGYDEVRPIFAKNCAACHPSRSGPNWLEYSQAKPYADSGRLKQRVVTDKSMPPPGSPQAGAITNEERAAIGRWADAGAPEVSNQKGKSDKAPTTVQATGLVQQCFSCHGPNGSGNKDQPKIPRLAGQNEDYLYDQLSAFYWLKRLDPTRSMNDIAGALSEEQMREAAKHFSMQTGLASDRPANPKPERLKLFEQGRNLAEQNCVSCHLNAETPSGTADPSIPKIAGQSQRYLMNQLLSYRSNHRVNSLMNQFASTLSDDDIAALSFYFSTFE